MNQVFSRGGSGRSVYAVAILLGVGLMLGSSNAHAVLFAKGNAELGAKLHAKTCASCHNSMMPDGKGEELYSEDFRKMTDAGKLKTNTSRPMPALNLLTTFWISEAVSVEWHGPSLNSYPQGRMKVLMW